MNRIESDPLAQARSLVPLLAASAEKAERDRCLHESVVAALAESGLCALLTPAACGGGRVPLCDYLEIIATLGEGCVSSAWVCSFFAVHSWMLCLFEPKARDEILRHGSLRAAGLVAAKGTAIPRGDGYVVTGRWEFGSGILHSDWAMISALTRDRDGDAPNGARLFLIPRSEIEVIDTWHVDGMAATGSCDVAVDAAFVPAYRSLDLVQMATGMTPGAAAFPDDPLYRLPLPPLLAFVAAAPALGAARASLRELAVAAKMRERLWGSGTHAQRAAVQMRLAEAEMDVRGAELMLRQTADELETLTPDAAVTQRARLRMQSSWGLTLCTRAVESLALVAGARAHQRSEPLQRRARDLRMMRCHVIFEPDATAEMYGRTLVGLDPGTLLV